MAKNNSANGTSKHTTTEMREWYEKNKENIENFAKARESIHLLRDVTKTTNKSIPAINKEKLKSYIANVNANEKNLRNMAWYMYYRSNILFRLVHWYANMFDLKCRKVTPKYDLNKGTINTDKVLKNYYKSLELLDRIDLQGNTIEALLDVFVQDVYFGIRYTDDVGMFLYPLDADECMINSRYSTGNFGFAVDMSRWKSKDRQQIIEYLGSPLKEMYDEFDRTGNKWIQMPDEYVFALKFRTNTWQNAIPVFLPLMISLANLEDLVDIQADADALDIYKLIYLPMKVHTNTTEVDDFLYDPAFQHQYFKRLIDEDIIPANVSGAMIPGDELKTIDFSKSADSDTTSVEKASNQILQTAGGGAVLNANMITSTAAFEAWLKEETEFAISTLLPQLDGIANMILMQELGINAATVKHFEVSVYTKEKLAKQLLESCQYSYANRIAYNTLLGISERESLIMLKLENEMLNLPELMKFPLSSSFTSSGNGEVGQGAPTKDSGDLSNEGNRSRNR